MTQIIGTLPNQIPTNGDLGTMAFVDKVNVDAAIALKAPIASPTLTGIPAAPTASVSTNSTQLATTAFVLAQVANDAPTKTGSGASGSWPISITGSSASTTGNAATATLATTATSAVALQTARTIAITGDATYSTTFDGSANVTNALTLATVATAGTYSQVTVDAKGRVTVGANPTTLAGYGITDALPNTLTGVNVSALHRSPNAIQAFYIYDTSKDSDPDWVERTANTSWYNEALSGTWLGPQATELAARGDNLLTNPEQFDNAVWLKIGSVSVTADSTVAPDGTTTADTLVFTSATVNDYVYQQKSGIAFTNGSKCAITLYTKTATQILSFGGGTVAGTDVFSVVSVGGGWYLQTVTRTITAVSGTGNFQPLVSVTSAGTGSYPVWGAKFVMSAATPYVSNNTQAGQYYQSTVDGKFYQLGSIYGTVTETFRGNKAKFPRLAAIISENDSVVIYDLTVAGQPMWMRFSGGGGTGYNLYRGGSSALAAINGIVMICHISAGAVRINFASDNGYLHYSGSLYSGDYNGKISQRNAGLNYLQPSNKFAGIIDARVNAVAMVVQPDAPIDPATGLLVPTIALHTLGGVSVIKQDGTISSQAFTGSTSDSVAIAGGRLYYSFQAGLHGVRYIQISNITGSSFAGTSVGTTPLTNFPNQKVFGKSDTTLFGSSNNSVSPFAGIARLNETNALATVNARIAPTYSTGLMIGDIRRAYLADTLTLSLGPTTELITNGTFATNTTGWTSMPSYAGTAAAVSGEMQVTTTVTSGGVSTPIATVIGKTYLLKATIRTISGGGSTYVAFVTASGSDLTYSAMVASATATPVQFTFVATSTTSYIGARNTGAPGAVAGVTNVSVKEYVFDRSYKGGTANIYGTLTRTPVATASQLVTFSGFSGSAYIQEPYSSDLDFGTGEWRVGAWVNIQSGTYGPHNFISYPESVDNVAWTKTNGGVGSIPVVTGNYAIAPDGTLTASRVQLALNGGATASDISSIYQATPSTIGAFYSSGMWLKTTDGSSKIIQWRDDFSSTISTTITVTGTWTQFTSLNTAATNNTINACRIWLRGTQGTADSADLLMWGGQINQGATLSTYRGRQTAAYSGVAPIVERRDIGQGPTNLLMQSEAISTLPWAGTAGANANGNTYKSSPFWEVIKTTSSGSESRAQGFAAAATGSAYTLTVVLMAGTSTAVSIGLFDGGTAATGWGSAGDATFAITEGPGAAAQSAGSLITVTGLSATVATVLTITRTFTAGSTSPSACIYPGSSTNTTIGASTLVTRFQVEKGRVARPYRLTTTATYDSVPTYGPSITLGLDMNAKITAVVYDGTTTRTVTSAASYNNGVIADVGATYTVDGTVSLTVNGVSVATATGTPLLTINNPTAMLTLGNSSTLDSSFPGSISLVRTAATAPASDILAWVYALERQMFVPGAQVCLPGAGLIQDLAYDESKDRWTAVQVDYESSWTGLVRTSTSTPSAGAFSKVAVSGGVKLLARTTTNLGVDIITPSFSIREEINRTADDATIRNRLINSLNLKAPLANPALTGIPIAPTAAVSTNTTQLATTAFVVAQVANDAPTKTGVNASGSWPISITGSAATTSGNAATATKLATARTITTTGDATYSTTFDGSANATGALTLSTVATTGNYNQVSVNSKGLVIFGSNPTTLSGYGITDAIPNTLTGVTTSALHRSPNSVTAFTVYDTSKDSDPEWIEKTTNTTWYNEPLNGTWLPGGFANELSARAGDNLLLDWETLSSANWSFGNTGVTVNSSTAPDGTTTATKFVPSTASGNHYVTQFRTPILAGTSTYSVYAKAVGYKRVALRVWDGVAYQIRATFDILAGTIVLTEAGSANIQSVGNGWFRISCSGTSANNSMGVVAGWCVDVLNDTGVAQGTFSGDGTSGVYLWGAKLNLGLAATPYVPTSTQAGQYFQNSSDGKFYKLSASSGVTEIFRGNKAKFPRIVGIVAESTTATIYDLTEPGFPMWMRFTQGGAATAEYLLGSSMWTPSITSLAAINGRIYFCNTSGVYYSGHLRMADFASDRMRRWDSYGYYFTMQAGISSRNTSLYGNAYTWAPGVAPGIIDGRINAIAIAVLPDAPIDPATGLQVPTVAVHTTGGVTVLKHDGTASNHAFAGATTDSIAIANGRLYYSNQSFTLGIRYIQIANITTTTFAGTIVGNVPFTNLPNHKIFGKSDSTLFSSANTSVAPYASISRVNETTVTSSITSRIASTYSTGYMVGDIRRAYLSDTLTVSAGPTTELAPATTSIAGLTPVNCTLAVVGGAIEITATATGVTYAAFPTILSGALNKSFRFGGTMQLEQSGGAAYIGLVGASVPYTAGTTSTTAVAQTALKIQDNSIGTLYLRLDATVIGQKALFSALTLQEIIPDRSYKSGAANIYGSLPRTAVGVSSQLVSYSGWSNSNYLQEAYSSDLDLGTSEWRIDAWVNIPTTSYGPHNLLIQTENFADVSWSTATSGTATQAAITPNFGVAPDGTTTACRVQFNRGAGTTAGDAAWLQQVITATTSIGSVWIKSNTAGSQNINIENTTAGNTNYVVTTAWQRFSTVSGNGSGLRIQTRGTYGGDATLDVLIWHPQVERGSIVNTYRTSGSTAYNGISTIIDRRDAGQGPQNLFTYSQQFDNAIWNKSATTYTANAIAAPDGTVTAGKVVASTAAGYHYVASNGQTLTSGQGYTLSIHIKAAEYTKVQIAEGGWGTFSASVDLAAATISSVTGFTSTSLTNVGSGWYRFVGTFAATANAITPNFVGYPNSGATLGANGAQYTGDATSGIYAWGAQLELSPVVRAYRVTTAAAYNGVATNGPSIKLGMDGTGALVASAYDGTSTRTVTSPFAYNNATYTKVSAHYTVDGALALHINGVPFANTTGTPLLTLNNSLASLTIGNNISLDSPFGGSIALLKIGASVPASDQSLWMYTQEAQMFRDGAQVCLPGSGLIQDLSYDESRDRWTAVQVDYESSWTGLICSSTSTPSAGAFSKVSVNSGVKALARTTTSPGIDITTPTFGLREQIQRTFDDSTIRIRTQNSLNLKAPLASPTLTGIPTAPTATVSTNTTQVATTAFAVAQIANDAPTKTGSGASGSWPIAVTGNSATSTKLATARNVNGVLFDGSADIIVPSVYDSGFKSILNPGGAQYTTSAATQTGALAIVFPVGMTGTMLTLTIKVYEYNNSTNYGNSFEVHCGGYNYSTGNTWLNNPFAYIVGPSGYARQHTVRFGYTAGGKAVIYIGELASTWKYPQFYVTEVLCGYGGAGAAFTTGWSARMEATAFENVTATITNPQVGLSASTNTPSTLALRDASGNFSAGTISAALAGNATTATTLQTARTINGVNFDGSSNIVIADATKEPIIAAGTTAQYYRGDKTWVTLDKTAVGLANVDNIADVNKAVLSATKLATARTVAFTGDATGTGTFDGTANTSTALTLATTGVASGTYGTVTVDTKGRVTAGTVATPIANGGTGATTAATARVALGLGSSSTLDASTVGNALITAVSAAAARTAINAAPTDRTWNIQTASYTLALTDTGTGIVMNVATGNTLTVPADATSNFAIDATIPVEQRGAGTTDIIPSTGVIIHKRAAIGLSMAGQHSQAFLRKKAANTWLLTGDVAPIWTPSQLSNTKAWFVADNPANTIIGGQLDVLADKSGNVWNASSAGSNAISRANLTASGLNGRTVWSSSSTQLGAYDLNSGAFGIGNNVPGLTMYIVQRMSNPTLTGSNSAMHVSNGIYGNYARATLGRAGSTSGNIFVGTRRLDNDSYQEVADNTNYGTNWMVLGTAVDYSAGTGMISVNGSITINSSYAWAGGNGNTSATNSLLVSIGHYGGGGGAFAADTAECIFIQGILSNSDRQKLEGYLAWQWGLQGSLPAGHPYALAAP